MLSRLREHLGTAGLVVAVVALVAALAGGAIAANGGSDGKATASAKGKKGPRGPKGPKGNTGPQGPAGPAGAKGDNGAAGANGKDGAPGQTGATGPKGATGPTGATGATGSDGATGPTGAAFPAGGTLPSGETLTGAWGVGVPTYTPPTGDFGVSSISFALPLPAALTNSETHYVAVGDTPPTECAGGSAAEPKAAPGHLCVYAGFAQNLKAGLSGSAPIYPPGGPPAQNGTSKDGAALWFFSTAAGGLGWGTWAVTAP